MSAAPSKKYLFAYLDHTHKEIDGKLHMLKKLVNTVEQRQLTLPERAELHKFCQFFRNSARNHHIDEEKHIFPKLLSSSDEKEVFIANKLTQDHEWLEANWLEIQPDLDALSEDGSINNFAELKNNLDIFIALYGEHMQLEESMAYPAVSKTAQLADIMGAGREMAQRRFKQIRF